MQDSAVPATRIGSYRVIANLGSGGMADVMLAAKTGPVNFTKLVVIKRLRAELARQSEAPRYRALLLDEARVAARMHHPNIVQTYEVTNDGGEPFITMEYLDGQPVSGVLRAVRHATLTLPVELSLRIVADILLALGHAHDLADFDGTPLNIVHRDVSPQNVFWTYDGEIKLMDFGVAKFSQGTTKTQAGYIKGKLSYMAPEQARGEPIDRRADVFAVGVMLWELLSGRRLFKSNTDAATLQKLLYEPIPPLTAIVPGIDPMLAAISDRALARDREQRYSDAATMRADIELALGDRSPRRELMSGYIQQLFTSKREEIRDLIRWALSREDAPVTQIDIHGGDESNSVQDPSVASGTGAGGGSRYTVPSHPRAMAPVGTAAPLAPRRRGLMIGGLVTAIAMACGAAAVIGWKRLHGPSDGAAATTSALAVDRSQPAHTGAATVSPTLALCGSNTIGAELGPALVEALLKKRGATGVTRHVTTPDETEIVATLAGQPIVITIAAHGTATAFEGLAQGSCDVGMASRAIKDDENHKLAPLGVTDLREPATEHVVGLDGIAVVVHPNNPMRELSRAQLHDIFTGKVTDWSQVGGMSSPITIYARDDKSGTYDMFKSLALNGDAVPATAKRFAASDGLADAVASDPTAVGFIGLAYVRSARAIALQDAGAGAMLPSAFTVTTEDYLLSRRLYLYTLPKPRTPLVAELVSFATSTAGQDVVRENGFVELTVMLRDGDRCDERCPKPYAAAITNAKRVSLDFRFRGGGNALDSRAAHDLDRLVQLLHAHPQAKLLLFGFSATSGDPVADTTVSRLRARSVAHELEQRGVIAYLIDGFGDAMPVASNETEAGRERNRRVEVWMTGS
jgi:phosphate transport system substrate-binding protein